MDTSKNRASGLVAPGTTSWGCIDITINGLRVYALIPTCCGIVPGGIHLGVGGCHGVTPGNLVVNPANSFSGIHCRRGLRLLALSLLGRAARKQVQRRTSNEGKRLKPSQRRNSSKKWQETKDGASIYLNTRLHFRLFIARRAGVFARISGAPAARGGGDLELPGIHACFLVAMVARSAVPPPVLRGCSGAPPAAIAATVVVAVAAVPTDAVASAAPVRLPMTGAAANLLGSPMQCSLAWMRGSWHGCYS